MAKEWIASCAGPDPEILYIQNTRINILKNLNIFQRSFVSSEFDAKLKEETHLGIES